MFLQPSLFDLRSVCICHRDTPLALFHKQKASKLIFDGGFKPTNSTGLTMNSLECEIMRKLCTVNLKISEIEVFAKRNNLQKTFRLVGLESDTLVTFSYEEKLI